MKLVFTIFLFSVLATFDSQSHAQENEIKGRIIDSISKNPLSFINIRLELDNNIHVRSSQSNEDGTFQFKKLPGERYTIRISSVSHQSKYLVVALTRQNQVNDLGLIYLQPNSNQLNEVLVKGTKQLITHEIDRISYDLQADPDSRSSSLLEMIKKVPLLSLIIDFSQGRRLAKLLIPFLRIYLFVFTGRSWLIYPKLKNWKGIRSR